MNTKNLNVVCAITLTAMTVVACGGSGSDEGPVLTGVFVDSPVAGMKYVTPTVSGVTTADGEFNYRAGEAVVFSVGNLALPVVIASDTVTPLDMTTTDDINDAAVINVARLLQSLDEDGDPSNGIVISQDTASAFEAAEVFDATDNTAVGTAVNKAFNGEREAVSSNDAMSHFVETLSENSNSVASLGQLQHLVPVDQTYAGDTLLVDESNFALTRNGVTATGGTVVQNGVYQLTGTEEKWFVSVTDEQASKLVCIAKAPKPVADCEEGVYHVFEEEQQALAFNSGLDIGAATDSAEVAESTVETVIEETDDTDATTTEDVFPVCLPGTEDADGDGFAWQDDQSCVIPAVSLIEESPATPEPVAEPEPEPVVAPEPVTESEPVVAPEPVAESEPVVAPEPVAEPELVVAPEPVAEPEPVVAPEPAVEPEPVVAPEPVAEPELVEAPEPVAEPEPVIAPEPVAEPEIVVAPEPVAESEPGAAPEPVAVAEPASTEEAAEGIETAAVVIESAIEEPVEPIPAETPDTVVELDADNTVEEPVVISVDTAPVVVEETVTTVVVDEPEPVVIQASDITDLIVLTGQTNAAALETGFDAELDAADERVFAFVENEGWQVADLRQHWDGNLPGNFASSERDPYNNLAFQLGKVLAEEPDRVVGIILITAPGEGISHWDFTSPFYAKIRNRVTEALAELPQKQTIDAMIWAQGETDWLFEGTADVGATGFRSTDSEFYRNYYPTKLSQLISNLRGEFWFASQAQFICAETKKAALNPHLMALNTDGDDRTACAQASDLETRAGDPFGNQLSASSLRTLGGRIADIYLGR